MNPAIPFINRCLSLPERCRIPVAPTPVAAPSLIAFNEPLARELGIGEWAATNRDSLAAVFSGNQVPEGAAAVALAYAGHQFGGFVPQLGDGRALLMGDLRDGQGRLRDIQWKGTGRTPFSRGGDGRAALGPVLREYLLSEAMHALGVPTTRALAATVTGETVLREGPLPGAVVTRVAASHLRIGTFQYFAVRRDVEALRALLDHAIERHYPALVGAERPALGLLEAVANRQAALVARWLSLGFIHGVMNTDNMTLSGETIDYGPCAFMEAFDPDAVFSAIDTHGRYAYAQQPHILQWNLARFAETLLPLIADDPEQAVAPAMAVLEAVPALVGAYWLDLFRHKLGLSRPEADDAELVNALARAMHATGADFTLTFRQLADELRAPGSTPLGVSLAEWLPQWRSRIERETGSANGEGLGHLERAAAMDRTNPLYLPRNHLVEAVIRAAEDAADFGPFHRLLEVVTRPCEARERDAAFARPASPEERVTRTFCGT